jgi:hypothetical protein
MQSVLTVICSTLFAGRGYHDAHTIPCKRIVKLLRDCRIVLCNAEMPRHGRRGKEKSSHGWRVSTVSSGIENPGHNSYRHLTAKRSPHDSTACPPTTGLCHVLKKSTCTQAAKHITMGGKEYNWIVERKKA